MKKNNWQKSFNAGLALFLLCSLFSCNSLDEVLPETGEEIGIGSTPGESLKILVDASHDGGVWWFPQSGTYHQDQFHQGTFLANYLRESGFIVDELGRNVTISDQVLESYNIIIRAGGFSDYTEGELTAYQKAIDRGISLLLLSDHKTHDPNGDRLAEMLGLQFAGTVHEYSAPSGAPMADVSRFSEHAITKGLQSINDIPAATALMNAESNNAIQVLAWFSENAFVDLNFDGVQDNDEPTGMPFIGVVKHPTSKIFFMTDINTIERVPEDLIDNIADWIRD
ncbi:MAG: hypothetical protein HEP71_01215 [Roseivirga sp.]|nr:hypothetical protein [Roseivirga sp.]